jgi:hypothetical protein
VSTLIVEELHTFLDQEIVVSKAITVATIRPWLYFHNNPSGTFYFNIYKSNSLVRSFSFNTNEVKNESSLTEAYFHSYFSIQMTPFVLNRGTYNIKLEHFGYTYNENSFMGWCKDLHPYGEVYGTTEDYTGNPFSFTIIEYKARET